MTEARVRVGAIVLLLVIAVSLAAPWLAPYDPAAIMVGPAHAQPSRQHLMGTDHLGRDLFSRVLYGGRVSLSVGLSAAGGSLLLGLLAGLAAGYYGGWLDGLLMRLAETIMTFPLLVLALTLISLYGASTTNLILILSLTAWPRLARIVRAEVKSLRQREYVWAAMAAGAGDGWIVRRHLLPSLAGTLSVYGALTVAAAILAESALSYFGLGVQGTAVSWGALLSDGKEFIALNNFWHTFFPGLCIFTTVLAVYIVGDGLRDALAPRGRPTSF